MDIVPKHRETKEDEDDLNKLLAGAGGMGTRPATETTGLQFEEVGNPGAAPTTQVSAPAPVAEPRVSEPGHATPAGPPLAINENLETIKKSALEELRPLVDKLNLSPEDRFDTLLLIIRSTDDQSLLATAHEAAQAISNESKRAQALLDIIKEIDYFSSPQQQ